MKAARLYEYDPKMNVNLKIEEVAAPTITAPDEVIVRVGAAGLCRTDLHIIEGVWKPTMDPDSYCVLLGIGGLGHIALQSLHAISGCRIIAVDREPAARVLAKDLGADFVLDGGPNVVEEVKAITGGGAHVVIDFVGELGVEN